MKETAKDYFLGRNGRPRLNCAQSVAEALKDQFPITPAIPLSQCGGGRAPDGLCGAFYAARCILEQHFPDRLEADLKKMETVAGSLQCRQIKALKKLPCAECVGLAVEVILHE